MTSGPCDESQTRPSLRSAGTDHEGATSVEYGLILAAIAAVIIATVFVLGARILFLFQSVEGRF